MSTAHNIRENPCPCCESESSELFAKGRDLDTYHFYSSLEGFERLNYVRCLNCGLIYSNPRLAYTDSTLHEVSPGPPNPKYRLRETCESYSVLEYDKG